MTTVDRTEIILPELSIEVICAVSPKLNLVMNLGSLDRNVENTTFTILLHLLNMIDYLDTFLDSNCPVSGYTVEDATNWYKNELQLSNGWDLSKA